MTRCPSELFAVALCGLLVVLAHTAASERRKLAASAASAVLHHPRQPALERLVSPSRPKPARPLLVSAIEP